MSILNELLGQTEPDDLVVADRPGEVFIVRPDVAQYGQALALFPPVAFLDAVILIPEGKTVPDQTIEALRSVIPGASDFLAQLVIDHNWFATNEVYNPDDSNPLPFQRVVLNNVLSTYAHGDGTLSPDQVQEKIQLVPQVLRNLGNTPLEQFFR
jgi:hypothetical protein